MSWSLRVRHGDFTLSGASFGTVTNEEKLAQDLRCWILERMGTDTLHPSYGSLIDGGLRPDGTVVQGIIGESDPSAALLFIETEVHRIIREYQAQQLSRAKVDRLVYNKTSLTAREVLLGLTGIHAEMVGDTLNLILFITTAAGQNIDFTLALPTDGSLGLF